MTLASEKQFKRTVFVAAIAVIGLTAVPFARAADEIVQPAQPKSEAGVAAPAASETQQAAKPESKAEVVPAGATATTESIVPVITAAEARKPIRARNEVELGIVKTSEDSYKFGEYNGLYNSDPHAIINLRMSRRNEDNANYMEIIGRNLGLETRNLKIRGGQQGNYGIRFEYDEMVKMRNDDYWSPYNGMGTTRLTLPGGQPGGFAGWAATIDSVPGGAIDPPVAGTIITSPMMTTLAASMQKFNVDTKRKATELGLTKQLRSGWDVAVSFREEKKDGTKLTGAPMQLNTGAAQVGGSRGTVVVPEPINYTTDQFDVYAHYAAGKLKAQVGYYVSLFSNANRSLEWDNMYYNPLAVANGGTSLTGRLGQMPDNQFHQINTSAGYTISDATQLTGSLNVGRMTQNDTFLPYDVANRMPTTTSLNGRIDTTHLDIKLNSKLSRPLSLTTGYRYDDRDNRTPVNTYDYTSEDNTAARPLANIRRNDPLSKKMQTVYADLDYHTSAATRYKLGYNFDKVEHTYSAVTGYKENTLKADVKHNFTQRISSGIGYAHSDRRASSTYDGENYMYKTYQASFLATLCVAPNTFLYNGVVTNCTGTASATSQATIPFLDTPAMHKFYMDDRKRDKLDAFYTNAPNDKLDLQINGSYYIEKFPSNQTGFGRSQTTGWLANFDARLAATETVTGTFFTTLDSYETVQNGHIGASSATAPVITTLDRQNNTPAFDPLTGTTTIEDRSVTVGLGIKVKPGGDYDWGGDFLHASTTGETSFSSIGSRLTTVLPMPDLITTRNRLDLYGNYRVKKDMSVNVRFVHETLDTKDWAWDGQTLTSTAALVNSYQVSTDYDVDALGISLTYNF